MPTQHYQQTRDAHIISSSCWPGVCDISSKLHHRTVFAGLLIDNLHSFRPAVHHALTRKSSYFAHQVISSMGQVCILTAMPWYCLLFVTAAYLVYKCLWHFIILLFCKLFSLVCLHPVMFFRNVIFVLLFFQNTLQMSLHYQSQSEICIQETYTRL